MPITIRMQNSDLTFQKMTNLFLYGSETTPKNKQRIINDSIIIKMDMQGYMTEGAGRYVKPSSTEFVKNFFDPLDKPEIPDGAYTVKQLVDNYGYSIEDFKVRHQQSYLDPNSSDYAERTYIYNSTGYIVSDRAKFVIKNNGNTRYVENMAMHAYHDNFDFESNSKLTQVGNTLLKARIDPNNIGKIVTIQFQDKYNVPEIEQYTAQNYLSDTVEVARTSNNIMNFRYTLGAMYEISRSCPT